MTRAMFRYEVPIDDDSHIFDLSHSPVAVAAPSDSGPVEFWCEHTDDASVVTRAFQVFGTGHRLPDGAKWIGTCPRTRGGLVWHLYEVTP